MKSVNIVTTANYSDSEVRLGRVVSLMVTSDKPVFIQTARISEKDKSLAWDIDDNPFPSCDVRFSKIGGIRFKTNGGAAANVFLVWTYPEDDIVIESVSSNI